MSSPPETDALEPILAPEDARAYRRFVEWSIGGGFKLAIIEVATPRDRDVLVAWAASAAPGVREVQLDQSEQQPVWVLLEEAFGAPGQAQMLVLTRLEELRDRSRVCAQLNIQRDELVRAFAVPWVLLVHPSAALDLQQHAPDFCDFAVLWVRARPGEPAIRPALPTARGVESPPEHLVSAPVRGASEDDLLDRAYNALVSGLADEAGDLLAAHDLRHPEGLVSDPMRLWIEAERLNLRGEPALALAKLDAALPLCSDPRQAQVHAHVLWTMGRIRASWGELDEALRLYGQSLQLYEQMNDQHSRAVVMGATADILETRGELDEALRIRQMEELPVYEKVGDVRSRAVTLSKIANILQARGELDEALRILQQDVLPAYDKVGHVRGRAVTLSKIANILQAQGELDEALRICQQDVLPVSDRLGDMRSRAVTLGKVADILQERGELDEALRIRQAELLPVYEKVGDVRSRAVTLSKIADILQARGELDEALRLLQQEVLPVAEKLGDVRGLLVTRAKLALGYLARGRPGDREAAARLLDLALEVAERLRLPDAAQIRAIQQHHGLAPAS